MTGAIKNAMHDVVCGSARVWRAACVTGVLAATGCASETASPGIASETASETAEDSLSGDAAAPVRAPCEGGGRGAQVGCAEGLLVDASGAPVAGVRVAACTPATCITGTSDAAGRFAIQGLPVAPHKFEALAVPKGLIATVFFADVTAGRMVGPARPVTLLPLPAAQVFDPAGGGTVVLADGAVTVTAEAAAVAFPIGMSGEGLAAVAVPAEALPGYDLRPWDGREAGTFAVAFHPFPLKIEGPVTVALRPPAAAGPGPWDLHAVDGSTARLTRVGPLELGADGLLRVTDPTALHHLTVLVAVPR